MPSNIPPIIVALDFPDAAQTLSFVTQLSPQLCRLKVGKELFTAAGPALVEQLQKQGFEVFLDLKYHDIPNTVAQACKVAAQLGVWMVNVHALGGSRMMSEARNILEGFAQRPLLIAVSVLTSHSAADLQEIGFGQSPLELVSHLSGLAHKAGLDGMVCSAWEAEHLKRQFGAGFKLVTPGIRPAQASQDDQSRIMTPKQALNAGSDYLVIGRPITRSSQPQLALEAIVDEINGVEN